MVSPVQAQRQSYTDALPLEEAHRHVAVARARLAAVGAYRDAGTALKRADLRESLAACEARYAQSARRFGGLAVNQEIAA